MVVWRKVTVIGTQIQEEGLGEKRQRERFGKCESIAVVNSIESAIGKHNISFMLSYCLHLVSF